MKYLSLFSGIGGFELGIKKAYEKKGSLRKERLDCVGYSEIDKYAIEIYEKHFNHKNFKDITLVRAYDLPDFDFLVGGFPCQSFSIAGKRRGFEDTRGTLFFEIARILEKKRPRFLLLENVKGLLSHDEGRTFFNIISTLDELGYDCEWQVLNSKNFGVPQNRERIYIVGHFRGVSRRQIFPFTADGQETHELSGHVANTLTRRYEGAQAVGTYIGEGQFKQKNNKSNRQNSRQEQAFSNTDIKPRRKKTATHIRRLTPTECERLQGFPDGWTSGVSDTQRYKCLGNAVTVNVIEAIMNKLF